MSQRQYILVSYFIWKREFALISEVAMRCTERFEKCCHSSFSLIIGHVSCLITLIHLIYLSNSTLSADQCQDVTFT
jgi:hypothetical protein